MFAKKEGGEKGQCTSWPRQWRVMSGSKANLVEVAVRGGQEGGIGRENAPRTPGVAIRIMGMSFG